MKSTIWSGVFSRNFLQVSIRLLATWLPFFALKVCDLLHAGQGP